MSAPIPEFTRDQCASRPSQSSLSTQEQVYHQQVYHKNRSEGSRFLDWLNNITHLLEICFTIERTDYRDNVPHAASVQSMGSLHHKITAMITDICVQNIRSKLSAKLPFAGYKAAIRAGYFSSLAVASVLVCGDLCLVRSMKNLKVKHATSFSIRYNKIILIT